MKRIICVIIIFGLAISFVCAQPNVKKPNVSGQFYSANRKRLSSQIDTFFASAAVEPWTKKISIVMSPHAGYVYSGAVAAYGYKAASEQNFKTIVILAPSHFHGFEGVSIWPDGSFETPLGSIEVDSDFIKELAAFSGRLKFVPQAFNREHSLEVQLPFLQKVFSDFKIVPIITGFPEYDNCEILASGLAKVIGDRDDILIVASTDMSHYKDDAKARAMDQNTLDAIKDFKIEYLWKQCRMKKMELCGLSPVTTALIYAKKQGIDGIEILKYANSGDVTGDKRNVVGYSSIVLYKKNSEKGEKGLNKEMKNDKAKLQSNGVAPLTLEQKKILMKIAETTIKTYIKTGKAPDFKESDQRLSLEEGAFVTIHKKGRLRGCIGNIIGREPLYLTVRNMAIAAAVDDPRFPPLKEDELDDIDIEISVLSKPWRVTDINEIKAGVHGVIVKREFRRGVFLPQVAEEFGWNEEQLLSNLCSHKAGLPPDAWKDPKTIIEIFTANVFSQEDIAK